MSTSSRMFFGNPAANDCDRTKIDDRHQTCKNTVLPEAKQQSEMKAKHIETVHADGREIQITHPDKVLFPEDGITKGDLIGYYRAIGEAMLPYLESRPLAMQRFPDGIDRPGFFQKAAAKYYPEWIETATVAKAGGTVRHVVCNDIATLVYLANQACITPHVWLSRADKVEFPDQMIFDLDPATEDVSEVVEAAYALKDVLDNLELPSYVKATGSRGMHVAVPLDRKEDFESVRGFARGVAEIVVARAPNRYTMEQYKLKRRGRLFVDVNRNAYAQTAVATYAVRARRGAPVSVPLRWDELRRKDFRPDGATMQTVLRHLDQIEDPWKEFWSQRLSLDKARRKLPRLDAA
jgi:bifunctional non-homologous end joining protein LigD